MIREYFKLAVKNLGKRKLRSWLTMIGIFVSIATIFTLVSLSLGLQNAVEEQFRLLGTDKIFIQPKTGMMGPPGSIGGNILTTKDIEVIEKIRGVKDFSYFTMESAKVEFSNEIKYFSVIGVPLDHQKVYEETSSFKIAEGRNLKWGDKNSIVVGNLHLTGNIWEKEIHAGENILINSQKVEVKGILEKIGNPDDDRMILMNMESFSEIFNVSERIDMIMVQIEDGENILEVADRIEKNLRKSKDQTEKTQDFIISTPEDLLGSFQTILNIITYFLAGIATISLLVGAIGISNTMYTSVIERTKEIGIMKAIGAKNSDILWIFLIESGLLGLIGSIMGVLLGFGLSKTIEFIAVNNLNTTLLQTASPIWLIAGCLSFGFLIGAVSGTLPAIQASKTNVVDALRYE